MMAATLLDRMEEAWARVMADEKRPARWRINRAALIELAKDSRLRFANAGLARRKGKTLLGAPITVIDDRSDVPSFYLHSESRNQSRNEDL